MVADDSLGSGEIGEKIVGTGVGGEALEAALLVGADAGDGIGDLVAHGAGESGTKLEDAADHRLLHLPEHVGEGGGIALLLFAEEVATAVDFVFAVVFLELAKGGAGFQVTALNELGGMPSKVGNAELIEEGSDDLALLLHGLAFIEGKGSEVDGRGWRRSVGSRFAGGGRTLIQNSMRRSRRRLFISNGTSR